MCTLVVLRRPDHAWPLLLAANRDEMANRPSLPPGRHWPDQPSVLAGLDVLAGGTWFGMNDKGLVAAVLNRINTLGPAADRLSRGGLPLLALAQPDVESALEVIIAQDPRRYRAFNMLIADANSAFWVRGDDGSGEEGVAAIRAEPLPPGLSMITAHDRNDLRSPRIRRYLPLFCAAPVPDPEAADWFHWQTLLADRTAEPGSAPGGAMVVVTATGFGTVSSSLLALPSGDPARTVWTFAAGRPGEQPYLPVRR